MGGAQHPVIGNYGVMSAKNGAINVMICLTALSYMFYRRANRMMAISWLRQGNIVMGVVFIVGMSPYRLAIRVWILSARGGPRRIVVPASVHDIDGAVGRIARESIDVARIPGSGSD